MIRNIIDQLRSEIRDREDRIRAIQAECSHPKEARESVNKSNTGNYDPSQDCYWIEHTCHLCTATWLEDIDS